MGEKPDNTVVDFSDLDDREKFVRFVDEAQDLIDQTKKSGIIADDVSGDLFDVLNDIATVAFNAEPSEQVEILRAALYEIREHHEMVEGQIPFFGISVVSNEAGVTRLLLAD